MGGAGFFSLVGEGQGWVLSFHEVFLCFELAASAGFVQGKQKRLVVHGTLYLFIKLASSFSKCVPDGC